MPPLLTLCVLFQEDRDLSFVSVLTLLGMLIYLLALSVGQRLCINFSVSRANFLTTLCSHLDVTCSCYFWFSLFNVDVNYSCCLKCIEKFLVNYSCFGSCSLFILKLSGDK